MKFNIKLIKRFHVGMTGFSEDMEDFVLEQDDYYKANPTMFWSSFYRTCANMWVFGADFSEKQMAIIEREYNKVKKERMLNGLN